MRFGERSEDIVAQAVKNREPRIYLPAILREAVWLPAAIIRGKKVEVASFACVSAYQGRRELVVLLRQLVRVAVGGQVEAVRADRRSTLHVPRLPADQTDAGLNAVVSLRPTDCPGVLEGVVDVLQRNRYIFVCTVQVPDTYCRYIQRAPPQTRQVPFSKSGTAYVPTVHIVCKSCGPGVDGCGPDIDGIVEN